MTRLRVPVIIAAFVLLVGLPASAMASTAGRLPLSDPRQCKESSAVTSACDTMEARGQTVIQHVFDQYGIVLANRTAEWSPDELASVQRALDDISARFSALTGRDAAPTLKELLRGAVFYRDNTSTERICYTLAWEVNFYDLWTTYDQTGRTFYLAHEMGHLLDTRTSVLHLFMGEVSNEFTEAVGAHTDEQGRYQLGGNFPHYDSPGSIRHRTDSASEDWAESFATVMVPEFEWQLRDIGTARQAEVRDYLARWSYTSENVAMVSPRASRP